MDHSTFPTILATVQLAPPKTRQQRSTDCSPGKAQSLQRHHQLYVLPRCCCQSWGQAARMCVGQPQSTNVCPTAVTHTHTHISGSLKRLALTSNCYVTCGAAAASQKHAHTAAMPAHSTVASSTGAVVHDQHEKASSNTAGNSHHALPASLTVRDILPPEHAAHGSPDQHMGAHMTQTNRDTNGMNGGPQETIYYRRCPAPASKSMQPAHQRTAA